MAKPKSPVYEVHVRGPLANIVDDFRVALLDAGYTPLTAVNKLRSVGYLSLWLEANGLDVSDLTDERIQEYLDERRGRGHRWEICRQALAPLLKLLASRDMLPSPSGESTVSGLELLLARFRRYLLEERDLVRSTAEGYVRQARRFLQSHAPDGDVRQVSAADVRDAVRTESAGLSVATVQGLVSVVRSLLRFCHLEGLTHTDLSTVALSMTGRRHHHLPRGLGRSVVKAILSACDRRTALGRRDFAVLTMLLRLGLRANELASLTLDDINWRAAEITVHNGKGRRDERLPLPADVGAAVAAYLRGGRPQTPIRSVFLSAIAPIQGLSSGGVSAIVRRACRRAGVAPVGPHRLRHTLACEMVSAGAPLAEIGQLLRHRGLDSTVVYARAGVPQLRSLARPWPGEATS